MKVRYSYLREKFPKHVAYEIFDKIWEDVIKDGDFTLGKAVQEFEQRFAQMVGAKHAIGVANGTDAIKLPLKLLGVGPGAEVITASNTFVASAGAIVELDATPKFVDMSPHYVMDTRGLEKALTRHTKAIVPVHFCGEPVEMDEVMEFANKHGLPVVEDACQAVLAEYRGKMCGTIGNAGAISLHPLKNLNVFGDGGVIITNDSDLDRRLRLYRNHGMKNRDEIVSFGLNSRLDSVQAAVGNYLIGGTPDNVNQRRKNAAYLDSLLRPYVYIVPRRPHAVSCFHLYFFEVDKLDRDDLVERLNASGVEAKIHYKIPLYLQEGLKYLGNRPGDFPEADRQSMRYITLPVDEHLTKEQMDYMAGVVVDYMAARKDRETPEVTL